MTMISDLPREFVEDVFTLVPLISMRAVRLTCKNWNTLTKSERFLKVHIGKATREEGEYQMIVKKDDNIYLKSVVVNGDPYIEPKGKLTCIHEQVKISNIFHCEGLLLCTLKSPKHFCTRLVVWNPYCGQTKWFQPINIYDPMKGRCEKHDYALGYVEKNKSCLRSHKILSFKVENSPYSEGDYGIYDFDSGLWRTLDATPQCCVKFYQLGVSLKGNTYWCATKRYLEDISIVCFDFTRERFGPLLLLPFSTSNYYANVNLSCVREENLAVLFNHQEPNKHELIEIWIMTNIETEKVSWSKFLKVNMGPQVSPKLDRFIIDEEKKIAMCCFFEWDDLRVNIIGEDGYFRQLDVGGSHWCAYYVLSLNSANQAAWQDAILGKRLSNSEKLNFPINLVIIFLCLSL